MRSELVLPLIFALCLTACSPSKPTQTEAETTAGPTGAPKPAPDVTQARANAINKATVEDAAPAPATPPAGAPPSDTLIRAETLLARQRFSPGVVDGLQGTNFSHALTAFQVARGLSPSGMLDADTWAKLTSDAKPVSQAYTLTDQDVQGPFAQDVGEDFVKLAALPEGPQFSSAVEALAERFHMGQALLTALNPGVDLKIAGAKIVVVDAAAPLFQKGDVASVTVSKDKAQVLALDKDGAVLAFYPATVGSTERPSPSGEHKVNGVAEATPYVYDPTKLNWGPRSHGKLVIKPGPNGPVGTVWIDLNAPSYGIHGSPNPETIGKTASHGCVRLTNWDAEALAAGVKPGAKVTFEGSRALKRGKKV
jgi:lipoprotein-anchoring transpeptidase ErfK/SrfK